MEEVATLAGHKDRVWALAWSGRGDLATASGDGTVKIWRGKDGAWDCVQTLSEHSRTVRHVAWAHDGNTLACSSFDASISIWKRLPDGSFDPASIIPEASAGAP
ncbi:putative cytosolic iron-sulfur protein assembly protein CIAO1-like protein [Diplonema papillatum]|nr:putative cytosolic iron-sulfur protein assembly protein CIAO1-like protein [Diplonema papillatum]